MIESDRLNLYRLAYVGTIILRSTHTVSWVSTWCGHSFLLLSNAIPLCELTDMFLYSPVDRYLSCLLLRRQPEVNVSRRVIALARPLSRQAVRWHQMLRHTHVCP